MKEASQAELSNAAGFKLSFASFSPGICAFLAACAIVLAVIWKDDKFEGFGSVTGTDCAIQLRDFRRGKAAYPIVDNSRGDPSH